MVELNELASVHEGDPIEEDAAVAGASGGLPRRLGRPAGRSRRKKKKAGLGGPGQPVHLLGQSAQCAFPIFFLFLFKPTLFSH